MRTAPRVDARPRRSPWRHALPLAAAAALGLALMSPAWPVSTACVVAATAVAAWFVPALLLIIVPAAMPIFDLAPWTGRVFIDEFDLLLAAGLSIGVYRTPPAADRPPLQPWGLAFAAFGVSLALSALRPLWPPEAIDVNSFSSFHSGFNGLRIAKGAVWAWLFVGLYRRIVALRPDRAAWFGTGMQIGLAATVAVVLWERALFVGWFDFTSPFRVSGPFSAMLRGGAYVECFLAVGSAFAVAAALSARTRGARAAAWALLAASAYALFVTYSRNGYAAFALVLAIGLLSSLQRSAPRRRWAAAVPLLLVGGVGASLVLGVGFAGERMAQTRQDLATRSAHWNDALEMRADGALTTLFGMGIGRFPTTHFWSSHEPVHAAGFDLALDDGNPFLRLGSGAPVYVEQIVELEAGLDYRVAARLHSAAGPPTLTVTLCRKWGLASAQCESAPLVGPAGAGRWQAAEATLHAARMSVAAWDVRAPLKLSLVTPGDGSAVDVDDVHLEPVAGDGPGRNAVVNGDFSAGMDRWFFTTDTDPPWHIHNLAVALLFDQGWFGLLSGAAVAFVALTRGWQAVRRSGPSAMAPWAGFAAFLVSGSLNTLIDAPRFLWLFLVLAWLCASAGGRSVAHAPARARRRITR